jgi:hypothetical protein
MVSSPEMRQGFDSEIAKLQRHNWQLTDRDNDLLKASLYKLIRTTPQLLGRGEFGQKTYIQHQCLRVWMDNDGEFHREDVPCKGPLQS